MMGPPIIPSVQPFIVRSKEIRQADPVISYYCLYLAVKRILESKQHNSDPQVANYVTKLLNDLELMNQTDPVLQSAPTREILMDNDASQQYVADFAAKVFTSAIKQTETRQVSKATASAFAAASVFLDLESVWQEPTKQTLDMIKYAKYQAARILRSIQANQDPNLLYNSNLERISEKSNESDLERELTSNTASNGAFNETDEANEDDTTLQTENATSATFVTAKDTQNSSTNNDNKTGNKAGNNGLQEPVNKEKGSIDTPKQLQNPNLSPISSNLSASSQLSSSTIPPANPSILPSNQSTKPSIKHNSTPPSLPAKNLPEDSLSNIGNDTSDPRSSSVASKRALNADFKAADTFPDDRSGDRSNSNQVDPSGSSVYSSQTRPNSTQFSSVGTDARTHPTAPFQAPAEPVAMKKLINVTTFAQKHTKYAMSALNYDDIQTAISELQSALDILKDYEKVNPSSH